MRHPILCCRNICSIPQVSVGAYFYDPEIGVAEMMAGYIANPYCWHNLQMHIHHLLEYY